MPTSGRTTSTKILCVLNTNTTCGWHVNESCPSWMSRVMYEWIMSYMIELCHICMQCATNTHTTCGAHLNKCCTSHMRHLTCKWVISYINLSRPLWISQVTYECVVSHMNESCHICMLCVHYKSTTFRWHVNESCPSWTSHVTYECVMSHMNGSCHI